MVGQREGAARAGGLGRPIEEIVAAARRRLHRLHPVAACAAMRAVQSWSTSAPARGGWPRAASPAPCGLAIARFLRQASPPSTTG